MESWTRKLNATVSLLEEDDSRLLLEGMIACQAAERLAGLKLLRDGLFSLLDHCGAPPACRQELTEAFELLGLPELSQSQ